MAATVTRRHGHSRRPEVLQKPHGVIHPRVQQVGPEHFGIVAIDCAKARSRYLLADFYGRVRAVLFTPEDLSMMLRLKEAFNPTGRCSPRKMLPTAGACIEQSHVRRQAAL